MTSGIGMGMTSGVGMGLRIMASLQLGAKEHSTSVVCSGAVASFSVTQQSSDSGAQTAFSECQGSYRGV